MTNKEALKWYKKNKLKVTDDWVSRNTREMTMFPFLTIFFGIVFAIVVPIALKELFDVSYAEAALITIFILQIHRLIVNFNLARKVKKQYMEEMMEDK